MARLMKNFILLIIVLFAFTIASAGGVSDTKTLTATAESVNEKWDDYLESGTTLDDLEGSGTASDPYLISTPQDLVLLSTITKTTDQTLNKYFKLNNNIDMGGKLFTPIGNDINPFKGKFLGNGKVIENLIIDTQDIYAGLFGVLYQSAEVEKLGIFGGDIEGGNYVGAIAGKNLGKIRQSFNTANVTTVGLFVGGLVGYNNGDIITSYNVGNVSILSTATEGAYAGGIVGYTAINPAGDALSYSYSLGKITSTGSTTNIGGVVGGREISASIRYSYFNKDYFSGVAIGGVGDINQSNNIVTGYTSVEFGQHNLQTLRFSDSACVGAWEKPYTVNDASAYFAPALNAFSPNRNSQDYHSYNSVIMRLYGINAGGSGEWGSATNPYIINTPEHLSNLSRAVSSSSSSITYSNKYFLQSADLNMSSVTILPIGNKAVNKPFSGKYDGGNHKISNLVINHINSTDDNKNYVAMFGYVSNTGEVKNLNIDSSCTFSGINYVASVVGYNAGKLTNIESRAKVQGSSWMGGVVGYNLSATLENILSVATFTGNVGSTNANGVIGQGMSSTTKNVWYMAKYNSNCTSTSQGGRLMLVGKNGEVSAQKAANGAITFVQLSAVDGYDIEFRQDNEALASLSKTYAPDINSNSTYSVYARFVHEISIAQVSSSQGSIYFVDAVNGELKSKANYYEGQKITLSVGVEEGHFLHDTIVRDVYARLVIPSDIIYTYDENELKIKISFTMSELYHEIGADISAINATPISNRFYDGEPTEYAYTMANYPSLYTYDYNYSVSPAPINAGSYSVIVQVKKDGVLRGRQTVPFVIDKRPLYVPEQALTKVKEFDNKSGQEAVDALVNQDIVASYKWMLDDSEVDNIVPLDIVAGGSEHRVVVLSQVIYNNADIGTGKTITYTFTLKGVSASNYEIPQAISYHDGEIIPRTVVYEIEEKWLSRVFDGQQAAVENFGTVTGKGAVSGIPVYPKITFNIISDGNMIPDPALAVNAGQYVLSITATGQNAHLYNAVFKQEYIYTVQPKGVEVTFTDLEKTYNTEVQAIGGYFYDVKGKKQILTADYFSYTIQNIDGEYVDAPLQNAGSYIAKVTLRDNYVALNGIHNGITYSDNVAVDMQKAEQDAFSIVPILSQITYGDSAMTLETLGGSGDGSVTYEILSGLAEISDSLISFNGGGSVSIKATKAESANYLATTATYQFVVDKAVITIYLDNIVAKYGDNVGFNFIFDGYVDKDIGKTQPQGFVPPTVKIDGELYQDYAFYPVKMINGEVGNYQITIEQDAISDGYLFDYSVFGDVYLTIEKKDIKVVVDNATSVYGATSDADLNFRVYDTVDGEQIELGVGEYNLDITLYRKTGKNVGTYAISCGQGAYEENILALASANTNYNITFIEGQYSITPKNLHFTMIGQHEDTDRPGVRYNKKVFGELDPTLVQGVDFIIDGLVDGDVLEDVIWNRENSAISLAGSITRRAGESAYTNDNPTQPYAFYPYFGTNLQTNNNYNIIFTAVNLRIYPAEPTFSEQDEIFIQYGDTLSSINPAEKVSVNVSGHIVWEDGDIVPDFSTETVQSFNVLFISSDKNYLSSSIMLEMGVIARELTIDFSQETSLIYNGKERQPISYSINNILLGDEIGDTLTYYYNGEPINKIKNAGEYQAILTIDNGNYILIDNNKVVFEIAKAPLEIYLLDILLPEEETPEKDFKYSGFVNGEDKSVLTTLPDVEFYTKPGNYKITPSGASADNYAITYRTSTQSVAKTRATAELGNFQIRGNFNYLMELELTEVKKAESLAVYNKINELYIALQAKDSSLSNMKLASVYDFSLLVDGETYNMQGSVRANIDLPTKLRETKKFNIIMVTKDGEVMVAKNLVRENNTLYFDMVDCEYFAIVCPPDYTWIILSAVVGLLIIGVLSLDMISEKMGIGRHRNKTKKQNN